MRVSRSLTRTIVVLAAASALGACADETTAPTFAPSSHVAANTAAPGADEYTTLVDIAVERVSISPVYGTTVTVAITCSTTQVLDIIVELEQQVRAEKGKQLLHGLNDWAGYTCRQGRNVIDFGIDPDIIEFDFELGRATVRARTANYQPGVQPADVTLRTRIVAY